MIVLFATGIEECLARLAGMRDQSLTLVQRLSGNLACMVDPHQRDDLPAIGVVRHGFGNAFGRVGTGGRGGREQGSKSLIGPCDESVNWGQTAV